MMVIIPKHVGALLMLILIPHFKHFSCASVGDKTLIISGITARLRKLLMFEFKTLVKGSNITCMPTINCNHIIASTLCTLETWFVAGV